MPDQDERDLAFAREVDRLRRANVPGASGRLRDLFDFLADRGLDASAASQVEISDAVFGQAEPDADDATVRVYVHRLRRRLEEHYAGEGAVAPVRLDIPAGTYALRLADAPPATDAGAPAAAVDPLPVQPQPSARQRRWLLPLAGLAALVVSFIAGWALSPASTPEPNAIWAPLIASDRPVLVVLGDYYIYGEIDPLAPEEGRLIRDFRVNSPSDLHTMQDLQPDRYGSAEDMGLTYLPFSSAYGLQAVEPLLRAQGKRVSIIAASALEADMLNQYDVVYVGLLSGMRLLEELNFMGSGFTLGESYDELVDGATGKSYISEEALSLASEAYYRDYAYLARYRAPSGALVIVLAGARDTGLRGLSPIVSGKALPADLASTAREHRDFEALFEITGQQGADLSERLLISRARGPDEL